MVLFWKSDIPLDSFLQMYVIIRVWTHWSLDLKGLKSKTGLTSPRVYLSDGSLTCRGRDGSLEGATLQFMATNAREQIEQLWEEEERQSCVFWGGFKE